MLRRRQALSSQGTGHQWSFCRTLLCSQPPSKSRPALLCCQAISSHRLQPKEMGQAKCMPPAVLLEGRFLLSWISRASPGAAPSPASQQSRHHRCRSRLSISFCTSSLPVPPTDTRTLLPRAAAGSTASRCISKNRASSDGT